MTIELKTFVIADYAIVERKPTLVGLFDTIFLHNPPVQTFASGLPPLPTHYLYAHCTCASMDGERHTATFRLLNDDAQEVYRLDSPCLFGAQPIPGRGLNAYLTVCVQQHVVHEYGDYVWELAIDNQRVGATALFVYPISQLQGLTITPPPP